MWDPSESIFFQALFFLPIMWLLHLQSFCSTLNSLQLVTHLKAWYPKLNSVPAWKLTNANFSRKILYILLLVIFPFLYHDQAILPRNTNVLRCTWNFHKHDSFFHPSPLSQLFQMTCVTQYPWRHIGPCNWPLLKSIQCFSDHLRNLSHSFWYLTLPFVHAGCPSVTSSANVTKVFYFII